MEHRPRDGAVQGRDQESIGDLARIAGIAIQIAMVGMSITAAVAQTDQTMDLHVSAHHSATTFKKFLYSWVLPETGQSTGFSGKIATSATRESFNEALISAQWIPSGDCPRNGEIYDTYQQIKDRYPDGRHMMANIVKSPCSGATTVPVNFTLPGGVQISHCVYVILDGAILRGGDYTMTSDLVMHYSVGSTTLQALTSQGLGDEFCFGMQHGCGPWHTASNTHSFLKFYRFARSNSDTVLVTAHGNASSSAMTPDLLPEGSAGVPLGAWSISNDLYMLPDCRDKPQRTVEIGDGADQPPASSVQILSLILHGNGVQSSQEQIHWRADPSGVVIPKDGCLLHLARKTGSGAINAEYQVTLFTHQK
jgi:hypothetical protein